MFACYFHSTRIFGICLFLFAKYIIPYLTLTSSRLNDCFFANIHQTKRHSSLDKCLIFDIYGCAFACSQTNTQCRKPHKQTLCKLPKGIKIISWRSSKGLVVRVVGGGVSYLLVFGYGLQCSKMSASGFYPKNFFSLLIFKRK